ncbi:restriction endonuclease subunit S, partial [Vibrio anguillarum]|nr:restriction endonuclease subunit S [Vibrio anguillarum]
RIAEEKAQLIKDKKIKKQKALPPIVDDEKLFGLANGWCFVRLDDICTGVTSGSTPPQDKFIENEGVPYLKVYNIRNQKIDFSYKEQFVDSAHHTTKLTRSILYPGDVVMNIVGPPLGK